jgi:RecB family exonuclease
MAVSFTKLATFEQCPKRYELQYIQKIPDLQPRVAADRGTAIHSLCEDYVQGNLVDLPEELATFAPEFRRLRELFNDGKVSVEGEWGFDANWQVCDWKGAWLRIKADAVVRLPKKALVAVDYKTGKKFGNEMKHADQLRLYAIACLIREPDIDTVHTENWYLDKDELTYIPVKAEALKRYLPVYARRFARMEKGPYRAHPNVIGCKWCPYRIQGDCKHAPAL